MFKKVRLLASALCVIGLGVMGCKSNDECTDCGSQYGYGATSASSYPTEGYPAPATAQPAYSSVPSTGTQMMPQTMPMQGQ